MGCRCIVCKMQRSNYMAKYKRKKKNERKRDDVHTDNPDNPECYSGSSVEPKSGNG